MAYVAETRTLYDRNAGSWVRTQPSSLADYTAHPFVAELCQPAEGKRMLDLGCGEGYSSRILRKAGAEVFGIDISKQMIERARKAEQTEPLGIQYAIGDAAQARLGSSSFDLVLAAFLFDYMSVDQMRKTMTHVHSMLRPGGAFVFAVPHPSFPFMREASAPFFFDIGVATYFGARNALFPGRIWKRDGAALEVQLVHKTLEDYFDALNAAGFEAMPRLLELRVTPEMVKLDAAFFSPLLDFPLHIAMKVVRR